MANSRSGESVLQRAMRILQCFDVDKPRLTAGQIASMADLSRSTGHRLASEMADVGMLRRNEDGTYSVSPYVWEMSVRANPLEQLRRLARPVMQDLHSSLGQHISLAVPDFGRRSLLYIDRYDPTRQLTILTKHATRLDFHTNSSGLAMLAFADAEFLASVLSDSLVDSTGEPTDPNQLREDLIQIRRQGYSHIVGGMVAENTAFAAPIFDGTETVRAALGVVARTDDCDHEMVIDELLLYSEKLSDILARSLRSTSPHPWPAPPPV